MGLINDDDLWEEYRKGPPLVSLHSRANSLYGRLPTYLQHQVDEDPDSGLEPEELPDGYQRLGIGEDNAEA